MLRLTLTLLGWRLIDIELLARDEDAAEVHELESSSFPFGFAPVDDEDEDCSEWDDDVPDECSRQVGP